jgi:methanogenic corrinoid protein MtbC1
MGGLDVLEDQAQAQARLVSSSGALGAVPEAAGEAFRLALPQLVLALNGRVQQHPRYQEFLAGNPAPLLADNHRHAAEFMAEVFSTSNFDLLAASLPWVYRSYHARGVPFDYFRTEIGLWKAVVAEQLPAEHSEPLLAVYDWMLAQHERVIELASESTMDSTDSAVAPEWQDLFASLSDALLAGEDERVLQLCRGSRDAGISLPILLQGLVYPVMKRVGLLWENGEITVADEHEITAIMNRGLAALYFDQPFPLPERGVALVAASVNEYHEMGAWMVATCLELDGWDVEYLGANVPEDALLAKARELQPQILALSVSMPFNLAAARNTIAALRARLPEVRVMIGGQAFALLPSLAEGMGADICLQDCQAAVAWARGAFEY